MKTLSFNSLKPLAFTALFIVFAASFNTAEAFDGCPHGPCSSCQGPCKSDGDCIEKGAICGQKLFGVWGFGYCECY